MSSRLKTKRSPLMVTAIGEPSPTHCAPPKKVSKAPRSARSSGERPPRRCGRRLPCDEEDVGDERAAEGDALLLAHVVAEVAEGAAPRLPGREHDLDLRARAAPCSVASALSSASSARPRQASSALPPAAEPLLQRAQRDHDRVGEVLEVHVGVLLAQLEDEAAEGVVVAPSLGPAVDAAGVAHEEGHHGAAQRMRRVGARPRAAAPAGARRAAATRAAPRARRRATRRRGCERRPSPRSPVGPSGGEDRAREGARQRRAAGRRRAAGETGGPTSATAGMGPPWCWGWVFRKALMPDSSWDHQLLQRRADSAPVQRDRHWPRPRRRGARSEAGRQPPRLVAEPIRSARRRAARAAAGRAATPRPRRPCW